jgi:NADH-quinone oxidoreductase subunit G
VHTEPGFVPISALTHPHPELIVPAHDTLFTSGTLGRYSRALEDLNVHQSEQPQLAELAGD